MNKIYILLILLCCFGRPAFAERFEISNSFSTQIENRFGFGGIAFPQKDSIRGWFSCPQDERPEIILRSSGTSTQSNLVFYTKDDFLCEKIRKCTKTIQKAKFENQLIRNIVVDSDPKTREIKNISYPKECS